MNQARNILHVLERAGLDFLVERRPDGWRVEAQPTTEGGIHYSCDGRELFDVLAHLAAGLALDHGIELPEDDMPEDWPPPAPSWDERAPYTVEPPVEFAPRVEDPEWCAVLLGLRGGCGCVPRPGWCAGCRETVDPLPAVNE